MGGRKSVNLSIIRTRAGGSGGGGGGMRGAGRVGGLGVLGSFGGGGGSIGCREGMAASRSQWRAGGRARRVYSPSRSGKFATSLKSVSSPSFLHTSCT